MIKENDILEKAVEIAIKKNAKKANAEESIDAALSSLGVKREDVPEKTIASIGRRFGAKYGATKNKIKIAQLDQDGQKPPPSTTTAKDTVVAEKDGQKATDDIKKEETTPATTTTPPASTPPQGEHPLLQDLGTGPIVPEVSLLDAPTRVVRNLVLPEWIFQWFMYFKAIGFPGGFEAFIQHVTKGYFASKRLVMAVVDLRLFGAFDNLPKKFPYIVPEFVEMLNALVADEITVLSPEVNTKPGIDPIIAITLKAGRKEEVWPELQPKPKEEQAETPTQVQPPQQEKVPASPPQPAPTPAATQPVVTPPKVEPTPTPVAVQPPATPPPAPSSVPTPVATPPASPAPTVDKDTDKPKTTTRKKKAKEPLEE